MNKFFLILIFLVLISSIGFAFQYNIIKDIMFYPEKYPRLPDNLEPYLCDNGKVDLDLAMLDIKKGMNPSFKRVILKSELNCGDD